MEDAGQVSLMIVDLARVIASTAAILLPSCEFSFLMKDNIVVLQKENMHSINLKVNSPIHEQLCGFRSG
jgi:hypothetical protein